MKHSESSLGNVCSQIWWCKFIVKLHRDSNNSITLHFFLLTLSDNRAIPSSIVGTKPDSACNCRRRTHTLIEHQTGNSRIFTQISVTAAAAVAANCQYLLSSQYKCIFIHQVDQRCCSYFALHLTCPTKQKGAFFYPTASEFYLTC